MRSSRYLAARAPSRREAHQIRPARTYPIIRTVSLNRLEGENRFILLNYVSCKVTHAAHETKASGDASASQSNE
jgi:hypothetical protein